MLFESDVIASVCNFLKKHNFEIIQQLTLKDYGSNRNASKIKYLKLILYPSKI